MKTMLDIYQDTYRAMSPAVNPFGVFRGAGGEAGPNRGEPVQPISYSSAEAEPETEEVGGLRRRVADLERLVASLAPGKPSPRKRAGRK
jgi:hypothetical protein